MSDKETSTDRESMLRENGYVTTAEMLKLAGCKDSRGGQLERKWLNTAGLHPLCIPLRGSLKRLVWFWHKTEATKLAPTAAQMPLPVAQNSAEEDSRSSAIQSIKSRMEELTREIQSLQR